MTTTRSGRDTSISSESQSTRQSKPRGGAGLQFPDDYTGDPQASNREIYVPLDNWWINLIQPVGGKSPWRDLMDKREGGHYCNFNVPNVQEGVDYLATKGGHRTLGNEAAPYACVNMPPLGVTVLLLTAR